MKRLELALVLMWTIKWLYPGHPDLGWFLGLIAMFDLLGQVWHLLGQQVGSGHEGRRPESLFRRQWRGKTTEQKSQSLLKSY